ncbi:MAG: tRNA (adenosine(37)-N6)-threonylcarbamoyltransferase complex dimerization subunit type 1 TsaB [Clostridia bacterium]|nr:tRNA (adenosine(37)-N6)-threonylcarbamoyltransferase complex dimerization subunit type 1 TsaB [Clostridia bacterium]
MLILSVDSTAQTASVSLSDDNRFLAGTTLNIGNKHSTTLLPAIKFILEQTGKSVSDVELFAATAGPGSYTGVRIGVATVKGLALGRNVPCIGVSSLETMAQGMTACDGIVCAMINARRDRFFTACFSVEKGKIARLTDDDTLEGSVIEEYLNKQTKSVYLVGDGAEVFLGTHQVTYASYVPEMQIYPNAYYAGVIAKRIYDDAEEVAREMFSADSLRPIYLRQPQAERELNERMNNK